MNTLYVGDGKKIRTRVRRQHCSGNVEGSALRSHVAEQMGCKLCITIRPSGTRRKRLDLPEPSTGERHISEFIRSGQWQYVGCDSYDEAHDFQWYVIEALNPCLNAERSTWKAANSERYAELLKRLSEMPPLGFGQLCSLPEGPGVYVLYHDQLPTPVLSG